jgi:hypothetical protein
MVEVNYSLVVSFLIVIAVAMTAPVIYDMHLAYRRKQTAANGESNGNPVGMPGLYRTIMTIGIILILGSVIFYVLTALNTNIASISGNVDMSNTTATTIIEINRNLTQQLTTISTILGGAIASIIGFYFGNRASESGAKAARTGAELAESAARASGERVTKAATDAATKTATDAATKTATDAATKTATDADADARTGGKS